MESIHTIHFTGAGGVGVAGVAHLAADLGYAITCSDLADSAMLRTLSERGIPVTIGHATLPASLELLVYSSAVPETDPERQQARERGIPQMRRGDFLNKIIAPYFPIRIAISGSHGKSTTAAMAAHLLRASGENPGYLVGATIPGWSRNASAGDRKILITEVDESDGTQAGFPATIAVVLNIDDDHSWALGGPEALQKCFDALCAHAAVTITTDQAVPLPELSQCTNLIGNHTRSNARVAFTAILKAHQTAPQTIPAPRWEAFRSFPGLARRMTLHGKNDQVILLEDYAHHPTELTATFQAVRENWPDMPLMVVFQPHRLERVQRYGSQFARLLSQTQWAGITAPFGAWRTDHATIDTHSLLTSRITAPHEDLPDEMPLRIRIILKALNALHRQNASRQPVILAVIGAGDITKLILPLKQALFS